MDRHNIRDRSDDAQLVRRGYAPLGKMATRPTIGWRWAVVTALVGLGLALCAGGTASASGTQVRRGAVVGLPVTFNVKNTNTSPASCPSDSADYTVGGTLIGPRQALHSPAPKTVTIYLHSLDSGAWYWTLPLQNYNYAFEMARWGHTSLIVDRLGYDSSGHPNGFQSCVGSQADVVHQIVEQLRSAGYTAAGGESPAFTRVVLAGHSISGLISQIEAYSYRDIDGLIVNGWTDQGQTQAVQAAFAQVAVRCAVGGEPAEPGGPGGYVFFDQSDADFRANEFHQPDPAVLDAASPLRNRNPCGDMLSIPAGIAADTQGLGEIAVPVLGVFARQDKGFQGGEEQMQLFTGSNDVTGVFLDGSGHFMALDAAASEFRAAISGWLRQRGFVTPFRVKGCVRSSARRPPAGCASEVP